MGKTLTFGFLLALAGLLPAQTPRASVKYLDQDCGWFSNSDLAVTRPPVIGQEVELRTLIPLYGIDYLQFGSFDPNLALPGGCRLRAHAFPPIRFWIPYRMYQRFSIPDDPALAGYTLYAQQLNWRSDRGGVWEMSRGVKLTVGY